MALGEAVDSSVWHQKREQQQQKYIIWNSSRLKLSDLENTIKKVKKKNKNSMGGEICANHVSDLKAIKGLFQVNSKKKKH